MSLKRWTPLIKMQVQIECPVCYNNGLLIELNNGCRIVTSGKPLKEYPCVCVCKICKRKIRYEVVKDID